MGRCFLNHYCTRWFHFSSDALFPRAHRKSIGHPSTSRQQHPSSLFAVFSSRCAAPKHCAAQRASCVINVRVRRLCVRVVWGAMTFCSRTQSLEIDGKEARARPAAAQSRPLQLCAQQNEYFPKLMTHVCERQPYGRHAIRGSLSLSISACMRVYSWVPCAHHDTRHTNKRRRHRRRRRGFNDPRVRALERALCMRADNYATFTMHI